MNIVGHRGLGPLAALAAAILLLGQGTALHHQHEIAADCPPGPCVEHGAHVDASEPAEPAAPGHAASAADHCLFCELLAQGRSLVPAESPSPAAGDGAAAAPAPRAPSAPARPDLGPSRARAPPLPA